VVCGEGRGHGIYITEEGQVDITFHVKTRKEGNNERND
jgi:hypothetical protein